LGGGLGGCRTAAMLDCYGHVMGRGLGEVQGNAAGEVHAGQQMCWGTWPPPVMAAHAHARH
jgi:hypothetical protein